MTTPTKREFQAQERRKQLIDTALRLFAEKGMEHATIKDIATEAGVAQGLLYHYFSSKDELFYAIIGQYNPFPELATILAGAEERPAREVLMQIATRAYALIAERKSIAVLILREVVIRPELQKGIRIVQSVAISFLTRYLNARIAAGELRQHDSEVTARMLAGSILALHLTDAPAETYLPGVIDTILMGIEAREASP
jgi:AcrR family transcriptional regulator